VLDVGDLSAAARIFVYPSGSWGASPNELSMIPFINEERLWKANLPEAIQKADKHKVALHQTLDVALFSVWWRKRTQVRSCIFSVPEAFNLFG